MIYFDIIIPTFQRPALLERTLLHISKAEQPASLNKILVVENGGKYGAETVCEKYHTRLPLVYLYESEPSLSNARNTGAAAATSPILLFIDDDIRVLPATLASYHDSFQRHGTSCFYGGPLTPDYDVEPELFLLKFLPWSAKGHTLGDHELEVSDALFLGGNMAVPRELFLKIGTFDSMCATGIASGGVGEESRLQNNFLKNGVSGIYVPGAMVDHYIPENRCDMNFVKHRKWRVGYTEGQLSARQHQVNHRLFLDVPFWRWKQLLTSITEIIIAYATWDNTQEKFEKIIHLYYQVGAIKGFRKELKRNA